MWVALLIDVIQLIAQLAKAFLISWRSSLNQVVASTLVGETLALSASLA